MAENKLADLSTEFAVQILKLTDSNKEYEKAALLRNSSHHLKRSESSC